MGEYNIYKILLGDSPTHHSDQKVEDFCSAAELLDKKRLPGIVIIDGLKGKTASEAQRVLSEIVELRRSPAFCCAPIYLSQTIPRIDMLADGVTSDIGDRLTEACAILEKVIRLRSEDLIGNHNLRLLAYMYVRGEGYVISPVCSPFSPWVYSYPEAALLLDSSDLSSKILKPEDHNGLDRIRSFKFDKEMVMALKIVCFLEENGYLKKGALSDRIRKCPKCKTGHLNYVDLCPSCGSIDFEKKNMIHCFVCGHVAPDDDFKKNMSFVCPKCGSVLRHLGSDYDHPLESHQCNDCGTKFIEPDVKADCLFCKTRTSPEDLVAINVYGYELTEKGTAAARTGKMQMEVQLFDGQNNLIFIYFCKMVEWLREYRDRYPDEIFSLLGIRFENFYEAQNIFGEEFYEKLMDELISRIRAMVRATDLTTSSAPDTFWVLLPRTPLNNSTVIAERIEALNDLIKTKSENNIRIKAHCFDIPAAEREFSVEKYLSDFSESL